jgi:hypothetical protein
MKTLSLITVGLCLQLGATISRAAVTGQTRVLTRISNETGVSVDTLQTQKSATGLGNGELEKANLLANATGKSFDEIAAAHQAGEGWGEIAHDNGLKLGKLVSEANRSSHASAHASSAHGKSSLHGNSATGLSKGHVTSMRGVSHGSSIGTGRGSVRGMSGMGHRGR